MNMWKPRLVLSIYLLVRCGSFYPGKSKDKKFKTVFGAYGACNQLHLWDCVLRYVSAHRLKSLVPSTSLKTQNTMDPGDKVIWNATYDEEYDGLVSLPMWEVISEDKYHCLSKGRKASPTMDISTI
jgi:hypothetical protein